MAATVLEVPGHLHESVRSSHFIALVANGQLTVAIAERARHEAHEGCDHWAYSWNTGDHKSNISLQFGLQ